MTIFAPNDTPATVSAFVRTEGRGELGHVVCYPIYGGFQMRIPNDIFESGFSVVPEERYRSLLQKYQPIEVCFDTAVVRSELMRGYTNGKLWNGWECPVFTREEIILSSSPDQIGALAPSSHSQIIWHEETRGFVVVSSQRGDLSENFDVAPYIDQILGADNESHYDNDAELELSLCRPFEIMVGDHAIEVYDINTQGWCWQNAEGMEFDEDEPEGMAP